MKQDEGNHAAHTPGPWVWRAQHDSEANARIAQGGGGGIASVSKAYPLDEWTANANLIAAAPVTAQERDRLKAINAGLVEALEFCATPATSGVRKMERARAALAKARKEG